MYAVGNKKGRGKLHRPSSSSLFTYASTSVVSSVKRRRQLRAGIHFLAHQQRQWWFSNSIMSGKSQRPANLSLRRKQLPWQLGIVWTHGCALRLNAGHSSSAGKKAQ
jgi:hypothetical protein